jgi:hypothetical protein
MEQILKELHRMIASQERMLAEVKAEVQQVRTEVTSEAQRVRAEVTAEMQQVRAEVTAELQQVRAEVQVWRAELEKTVRTVELNEAQLRTQILGTAAGLVRVEQTLQQEVAQMCAKLAMMQNEQEKKKGNEEERLNELMRERIEEFAQQLEEKEVARLQEHQQSLEEWLAERMCREFERQKRSQTEFNKKMAELVDKLKQESETKVTIVLEMCEQVAERLRMYESQLKIAEQQLGPELDKGQREPGEPLNFNFEAEKLADNDQAADKTTSMLAHSQREPGEPLNFNFGEVTGGVSASVGSSSVATGSLSPAGFFKSDAPEEQHYEAEKLADNDQGAKAADAQEVPTLDLTQSEENEVAAATHKVRSRRSTLPYVDHEEHEAIEGRRVYGNSEVAEVSASAGSSSVDTDPQSQSLRFDTVDGASSHKAGWSVPRHIEAGRLLQTPASDWIITSKRVEIPELGCVKRECKRVEIDEPENSQRRDAFEEGRNHMRDVFERANVIDRVSAGLDLISNELRQLRAIRAVAAAEGDADGG